MAVSTRTSFTSLLPLMKTVIPSGFLLLGAPISVSALEDGLLSFSIERNPFKFITFVGPCRYDSESHVSHRCGHWCD